jgi:hypothetical protein
MKSTVLALILGLAASTPISAQPVRWTTYTIPQTGTSVDFPPPSSPKKPAGRTAMDRDFEPRTAGPTSP